MISDIHTKRSWAIDREAPGYWAKFHKVLYAPEPDARRASSDNKTMAKASRR